MKLLRDLYFILSKSGEEDELSLYVQKYLDKLGIEYGLLGNQIYKIRPDTIMLCAHMDQVGDKPLNNLWIAENIIFGDRNLGADDKNGVWIVLKLLEKYPYLSFIFSTGEEKGCDIDNILEKEEDLLSTIKYCLVFDRQGGEDIISEYNNYCNKDLKNDIVNLGYKFGYHSSMGIFSDCDVLSAFKIPCVNLSCGYYQSHTDNEFTDLDELANALAFAEKIVSSLSFWYTRTPKRHYYGLGGYMYLGYGIKRKYYKNYEDYFDLEDKKEVIRREKLTTYYCHPCDMYFYENDIISSANCPNCGEDRLVYIIEDEDSEEEPVCVEGEDIDAKWYCTVCNLFIDLKAAVNGHCSICSSSLLWAEEFSEEERYYAI